MMVPAAIAVALVALGGGAWAVFGRGHTTPPLTTPGQHDTTHQIAANPPAPDTSRMSHADTTKTPKHPGTRPNDGTTAPSTINIATVGATLDDLLDSVDARTAAVLDSATHVYNAPGLATKDKAMAAFVIANAMWAKKDRAGGCRWVHTAANIEPSDHTYATMAQSQCAGN